MLANKFCMSNCSTLNHLSPPKTLLEYRKKSIEWLVTAAASTACSALEIYSHPINVCTFCHPTIIHDTHAILPEALEMNHL